MKHRIKLWWELFKFRWGLFFVVVGCASNPNVVLKRESCFLEANHKTEALFLEICCSEGACEGWDQCSKAGEIERFRFQEYKKCEAIR